MHRLKRVILTRPGALVMNLTQIVVEKYCIWGQSDYSWGHMNDSFLVKKWLYFPGQNKEMTPTQGWKWLYSRFRIRKWPHNVSQGGFKAGLISKVVKTYFERKAIKTRFKPVKTGLNLSTWSKSKTQEQALWKNPVRWIYIPPPRPRLCIFRMLQYTVKSEMYPGGGVLTLTWYTYKCACLLGHFFAKFGIAIGGFSSETKEPKLHKLGVFWANYCKKHPIWSKLGAFFRKWYTDGWEIWQKIGIEIVR